MAPNPRQLGMRIKALREARGMSQAALAQHARISRRYLIRLERGGSDPTVGVVRRLAKALGVTLMELLG